MKSGAIWLPVGFAAALVLVACGDSGGGTSSTSGAAGSGGNVGGTTSTTSSGAGGNGGAGGAPAAPEAPFMKSAVKMAGALHVSWTNKTTNCDKIYLDRKHDDGAYMTEYTLTGAATSQHDGEAIPPGSYCYKARCERGGQTSPDSNETCGTP